jgi:molybdopterin converting factor small subunit
MSIRIQLSEVLRNLARTPVTIEVEGSTVQECLEELFQQFPGVRKWVIDEQGRLQVLVLVNQDSAYIQDLSHKVKPGSEIRLLMIISGG